MGLTASGVAAALCPDAYRWTCFILTPDRWPHLVGRGSLGAAR
jgi:hypothetical protein